MVRGRRYAGWLGRMNTELVEAALSAHGRRLVVLDDGVVDDDLVRAMVEVLTSFCARSMVAAVLETGRSRRSAARSVISVRRRLSVPGWMMRVMSDMPAAGSVKVVVSKNLSRHYDRRDVVVDESTGEIVDDAQGYGYKTAQNAHRAHAYNSMPPTKRRQRDAAKRQVERWCAAHPAVMGDVEQSMFYALKDGQDLTETDVQAMLDEHGVELPFSVKDLMRHWTW